MRRVALLAVVVLTCAVAPASFADGDPASDYLLSRSTFIPLDRKVDKSKSDELAALLAAAKLKGLELRVAVIATKYDMGAVPVLYRKPSEYAHFLGQELFYWYKHELLVVMPNGYGLYDHGPAPKAELATVGKLAPVGTTSGNDLVDAAGRAVTALAAQRGIDLSHVKASQSGSSTGRDRIAIAGGAAVVVALAAGVVLFRRRRRA